MKISSIVARTCFLFELKMRSKLPFNATMSFSLWSLRKRFDHPRSRFCLVTQRSVAWWDKKGCKGDYHLAGCLGKQNGKILSKFSPSGFPLGSLNSIILIKNFPSIQPNPNESLFSASRECFQSRISPPFCPSIRQIPTSKYPFGTLVPLTPLVPIPSPKPEGYEDKEQY